MNQLLITVIINYEKGGPNLNYGEFRVLLMYWVELIIINATMIIYRWIQLHQVITQLLEACIGAIVKIQVRHNFINYQTKNDPKCITQLQDQRHELRKIKYGLQHSNSQASTG